MERRINQFQVEQAVRGLLRVLARLADLYEGKEVFFDPSERGELVRLGLAYWDPTSEVGIALASWVRELFKEVGERGSLALKAPNLGRFLEEEYLALLEKARDAAREGELELALDYYRKAMGSVGDLRTFALRFQKEIEEARSVLERELSSRRLVPWYSRLIRLYEEIASSFEAALSALGQGEERKDRSLLLEVARALEDRFPQEAQAVRQSWRLVAETLGALHQEVRRRLEALVQRKNELDEIRRFREALWKGARRAWEEGVLGEVLGAGVWVGAPNPLPGVWTRGLSEEVEKLLKGVPTRKERLVTLGEVPPFDLEEEPNEAQKTVEEFFAQREEKSFAAWASRRGYRESAFAALLLSLLLDFRREGWYREVGGEFYVEDVHLLDGEEDAWPSFADKEGLGEKGVLPSEGGGAGTPSPRA